MSIKVHVTPNAKEARVSKISEGVYEVKIDERATEGRANKKLLEIMSEYLRVR